tara:strand:- start:1394 stop:1678 length:285 start_codon:yes stop_codon:yes gene_type:complete
MVITGKKAVKINSDKGDGHEDGAPCIIIGQSQTVKYSELKMYVVIWEDFPLPVLIAEHRLKLSEEEKDIELLQDDFGHMWALIVRGFFILYEKK